MSMIRLRFQIGDLTDIPALAHQVLTATGASGDNPVTVELAGLFIAAASRAADADQRDAAVSILGWLRDLSIPTLSDNALGQIRAVEKKIGRNVFTAAPPPSAPAPATQPAPQSITPPATPEMELPAPATQPALDSAPSPAASSLDSAPATTQPVDVAPATQPAGAPPLDR